MRLKFDEITIKCRVNAEDEAEAETETEGVGEGGYFRIGWP